MYAAFAWLPRIGDKIYTAMVKEDIPRGFRSHIFVMRTIGVWPTANDSSKYKWLTVVFFTIFGFAFTLSMIINAVWVTTVQEATDCLHFSLNVWAFIFKSAIIYWRHNEIRELLQIHANLMTSKSKHNEQMVYVNVRIHIVITIVYIVSCWVFAYQSVLARGENSLYPSTSHFPYEFAQRRTLFWFVMVFQVVSCMISADWAGSMQDSVYSALINANCAQMADLEERLMRLGSDFDGNVVDRDFQFHKELVECCKRYEACAR